MRLTSISVVLASVFSAAAGAQTVAPNTVFGRYQQIYWQEQHGLPQNTVLALTATRDGYLWLGTYEGAVRFDGTRFAVFSPGSTPEIGNQQVPALLEDSAGTLWIATYGGGLTRFSNGRFTRFTTRDGLSSDYVLCLFEDSDGTLWGRLTSWSTRDGLASDHVKAFYEDRTGTLWIGGGGLSRFRNGTVTPLSARQGLYNDTVFQILEDEAGNLWMNCNVGISRVSLKDLNDVADGRVPALTSFGYGVADGMLSSEGVGAQPAGWKMRDGSMWFPTTRGVVVVDPRARSTRAPRVVIERVAVDGRIVPADDALRLSPGQENLEIQYTGLSWNRPHRPL